MRHYIVTNAAKEQRVYLASSNSGMIRVDGASSGCRECGRDIAKHGVMNRSSGIVNCDCGAGYAVREDHDSAMPPTVDQSRGQKCEISWIDCHGARTPDNNEAVGYAVIGKLKFHVCADHARTIGSGRCHHGACVHMTSGPSNWTFEPFAAEG